MIEREKVRRCGVGRVRRWRGYGDEERKTMRKYNMKKPLLSIKVH